MRLSAIRAGSVGTAGGNPLLHNVDNRAVQALPLHRLQVESAVYPPAWLSFQQVVLT